MNRRVALGLRILAILVIVCGVGFFVRGLDFGKLGVAFRSAKVWPLAVAAGLNFVCLWGKSVCWRIMLAPRFVVSVGRLFRYTTAAFAASAIAPARAGEVLRVWALKKRDGVPPADTAAVAVAEKLLDGVTMLMICAPIPWLLPDLPSWVGRTIAIGCVVAVVLFTALYIAVGRVDPNKRSWLRQFIAGMHVLRSPKRLFACIAVLLFVWAADLGEVMLVAHAVGVALPIGAGILILFTLNLAIMVPSTPAQVGALELGALVATDLLHIPREPAIAFALLYHIMQVVPLIIAGLALELRMVIGREPVTPPSTVVTPVPVSGDEPAAAEGAAAATAAAPPTDREIPAPLPKASAIDRPRRAT